MMNKLKSRSKLKLGKYSLSCCGGGIQKIMNQEASHDHGKERLGNDHDEIKWEVRPGGMLVQKRSMMMISDTTSAAASSSSSSSIDRKMINIRISTISHDHHHSHHISLLPTSTFGDNIGEVKVMMSVMTGLETREQRVLFKGKEREDGEYLHMVGVGDNDKLLILQDLAFKARKQLLRQGLPPIPNTTPHRTISV